MTAGAWRGSRPETGEERDMYVHNARETLERRRIVKTFRAAGAISPERAVTLPRLGLNDNRFMRQLTNQQIIREVKADEFYLDEDALKESQSTMLKWMAVPFALVLILMIYAIAKG